METDWKAAYERKKDECQRAWIVVCCVLISLITVVAGAIRAGEKNKILEEQARHCCHQRDIERARREVTEALSRGMELP